MVSPPPSIVEDAGAAASQLQQQLEDSRAQLAGTKAALATANDQLVAQTIIPALDWEAATHDGLPATGQGATDGAAAGASGSRATARPAMAAAAAAGDGAGVDDDANFLAAFDDEGASSADGEWPPAPYGTGGVHGRSAAVGSGGHRGGADFAVDEFDRAKRPAAGD